MAEPNPMQDEQVKMALAGVQNAPLAPSFLDAAYAPATAAATEAAGAPMVDALKTPQPGFGGAVVTPSNTAGAPPLTPAPDTQATLPLTTETLPPPQAVSQTEQRTQVTGGTKLDPVALEQEKQAQAKQVEATAEQVRLQAQTDQRVAEIKESQAAALADEQRRQEGARQEREARAQEQLAKIREAQKFVDENSMPPEESVGQSVVRGLALGLGALGRALGGNVDVNKIVAEDKAEKVALWKAQYERTKGKVAGQQNLYALFRQQGLDEKEADLATVEALNKRYDAVIKSVVANSASPLTLEQGKAAIAKLEAENAAISQKRYGDAQTKWTSVTDNKTKTGGVDVEDKSKLIKLANDDEYIKRYRQASAALSKFQDLVSAGADGAAIAEFIAGKGGLEQGSFGPNFVSLLKKRNIFGQGVEKLRETFIGGVDPALIGDLKNGLATELGTASAKAKPSVDQFRRLFGQAGIDPRLVTGGETSAEAASSVGATPSTYQGAR